MSDAPGRWRSLWCPPWSFGWGRGRGPSPRGDGGLDGTGGSGDVALNWTSWLSDIELGGLSRPAGVGPNSTRWLRGIGLGWVDISSNWLRRLGPVELGGLSQSVGVGPNRKCWLRDVKL